MACCSLLLAVPLTSSSPITTATDALTADSRPAMVFATVSDWNRQTETHSGSVAVVVHLFTGSTTGDLFDLFHRSDGCIRVFDRLGEYPSHKRRDG